MSNKILVAMFSVLLVVLLGEIGYLFFYNPVVDTVKKVGGIPNCAPPKLINDPLVSGPSLELTDLFLRSLNKRSEKSLTLKLVTDGLIKNINKIMIDNIEMTTFNLVNSNNETIRNMGMKEGDVVYKMSNGVKTFMSLNELKVDQKVEVTLIYDVANFDVRPYRELMIY